MSRKRRVFDIDMPDALDQPDAGPKISTPEDSPRSRSPMAAAISENAEALATRSDVEGRIRAENDALAHEYVGLKRAGMVIRKVALDDVVTQALVRDRKPGPDFDMPELVASLRDVGLSNPIRVEERDDGKFELIQGFRRLSAYKDLRAEYGDDWATIPATILPRGEGIAGLYRQMVDENLVRKDLSFAEMATVAQAYAADPDTGPSEVGDAVAELFKSASYSKRSYIRSFARLLEYIGPALEFPDELPRNLGLSVLKRIEDDEGVGRLIRERLAVLNDRSVQEELDVLRDIAAVNGLYEEGGKPALPKSPEPRRGRQPRTTFDLSHRGTRVKCTAGVGELKLKLDRDLTSVERRTLEAAILQLLDNLE